MLVQKNSFLEQNLIEKHMKKVIQKKFVKWFFHIKIKHIGFWEHIVRYQRTLMIPIFFLFWTAYLPWTETLFYSYAKLSKLTARQTFFCICRAILGTIPEGLCQKIVGYFLSWRVQMFEQFKGWVKYSRKTACFLGVFIPNSYNNLANLFTWKKKKNYM